MKKYMLNGREMSIFSKNLPSQIFRQKPHIETQKHFIFEFYTSYYPEVKYTCSSNNFEDIYFNKRNKNFVYSKSMNSDSLCETVNVSKEEFALAFESHLSFCMKVRFFRSNIKGVYLDVYQNGLYILTLENEQQEDLKNTPFNFLLNAEEVDLVEFSEQNLAKNKYSYIDSQFYLEFFMMSLEKDKEPFFVTDFVLTDDKKAVGKDVPPTKAIAVNDDFRQATLYKAKRNGDPSSARLKFYGIYDSVLKACLSEERAEEVYAQQKNEKKQEILDLIKELSDFSKKL